MKKIVMGLVGLSLFLVGGMSSAQAQEENSLSFWEKTTLTGTFNTSYTYNFNNPTLAVGNFGRVFNVPHNDFQFNRAELEIENAPADWAKFRLDLAFGEDVAGVDGLKGGVIGVDEFGVQQAYAELTANVGNGLTFTMGHFATLIGAEVIESAYNYNTSRSFLFGFAIPFTHTGLLISYPFSDYVSATVGVVNGWDLVGDVNKGKSAIAQLAFTPSDTFSFSVQGMFGPDIDTLTGAGGNDGTMLGLVDFVLTWQPVEEFVLVLNYDWADAEAHPVGTAGITDWQGAALIAHYDFNEYFGLSVRGEWFDDDAGLKFGAPKGDLYEGTLTSHIYMGDGWETRFEYRHDHSDTALFSKTSGASPTRKFQDTLSAEVLYSF